MSLTLDERGAHSNRRFRVRDPGELALLWQRHGDRTAQAELVARFLPLARRLAGRYKSRHELTEDLVQVASLGLLGAIDRFDPGRGVAFTSFAVPTILGELKRYFRNTGWAVHVPRGAQELALRVDRAATEITARDGRAPRVDELAEYLKLSVEDVLLGLDAATAHHSTSLDAPTAPGDDDLAQTLGESLGSDDQRFALVETKLSLTDGIARLPYQQRRALSLRIDHDLKQTEIAHQLGCSQMQVSRLLRRAAASLHALTDPELGPGGAQIQLRGSVD